MTFTQFIAFVLQKAGKQENLASVLEISPAALSKKLNGESGWTEREINKLLKYAEHEICDSANYKHQIKTFKEAMKILLWDEGG